MKLSKSFYSLGELTNIAGNERSDFYNIMVITITIEIPSHIQTDILHRHIVTRQVHTNLLSKINWFEKPLHENTKHSAAERGLYRSGSHFSTFSESNWRVNDADLHRVAVSDDEW